MELPAQNDQMPWVEENTRDFPDFPEIRRSFPEKNLAGFRPLAHRDHGEAPADLCLQCLDVEGRDEYFHVTWSREKLGENMGKTSILNHFNPFYREHDHFMGNSTAF